LSRRPTPALTMPNVSPVPDRGSVAAEWPGGQRPSRKLATISRVSGRVRYAGYGRRKILVTDGHEAEAKAAQLRRRPNRIGLFFVRLLGFRGVIAPPPAQGGHAGPSHEHPVHHEHPIPGT
jgi:hypothetical protein